MFLPSLTSPKFKIILLLLLLTIAPIDACQPANLRLIFMALTLLKGLQMVFFFVFGILVSLDVHLHQAYGNHLSVVGSGLSFMAFLGSINMVVGMKGSNQHNKFLLFVHLLFDAFLFFVQVLLGWTLFTATIPEFSQELREDCINFIPLKFDFTEDCLPYLQSKRTSGFELVWRSQFYER